MKTAPDPKDVQEFLFKQSHTSQILDAFTSVPIACSLLTADKKRGLLYVGQSNKIIVLKPGEDNEPEWKLELNIAVAVSKLMVNCDCSYLAVAPHGPLILIYDVQALVANSIQLLYEIRISTSNTDVFVNDLRWNPAIPGMLCTVASDYTVGSFKIKEKKEKSIELKALEKFNDLDVLCAAWSPKGKQIVVGCKNGSIVQFKPDLKVARTIPGPDPYIGEVIGILWISNYQFCAAYLGSEQKLNVLIIDAPKGETNAIFTSYEDITYGITDTTEEGIIPRYYFDHVPEWGLIIAASSNSSEVAVLGSTDGGVSWNQWQLVDSGRAELPLIRTTESYPVGLAIDKSSVRKLPWGAESTLPYPVPMLHILSTSGQLCTFHMVNLIPNCPEINSPPTEIVAPPLHLLQSNVNLSETSIVMNGLITSTPRPKQGDNITERPKPIPTRNIFDKSIQGNSFFPQSAAEKPKQLEEKSESASREMMKMEPVNETRVKSDMKLAVVPMKEGVSQESVKRKASADEDGRDIRAYIEEHNLFEKELRNKLERQTWECGTEEERRKLVETSVVIDQFLRELRETTNSLSSDISYLKALLLQSFAWVEETKSKNAATNEVTTRNCGDTNKISDLQKLYYYTRTQVSQASKILDLEWSNHKSEEMSRMKIPHLEFVYQNLILHNKIIQEEKSKLEHLKKRWKLITRNNNIFGLNRSLSNLSITSSKSSTSLPRNAGVIEARCKAIASKTLTFTQEKEIKLREHLSVSSPRIIKPVNPSPIQHRLEATLSSLASLDTTVADTKNKTEHSVLKQITPTKLVAAAEKPKQQSPLASLNSIVARIGTSETCNNVSTQSKQLNFSINFPTPSGNKHSQVEKKSTVPPITSSTVSQNAKPKQDTVLPFGQVSSSAQQYLPNLTKSFAKVNTITFGTPAKKSEDNTAEKSSALEESGTKSGKENVPSDSFKVENNLFGTGKLKDVLSETTSDRVQGIYASNSVKFKTAVFTTTTTTTAATATSMIPTTTKIEAATTFSFATANTTASAVVKSMSQNALTTPQTSAQTFSFALKPSNVTTAFNLKMPPAAAVKTTTASQTQDSLNVTNLIVGLETSNQTATTVSTSNVSAEGKYNYKPTFGAHSFQMLLGQNNTSSNNQISISLVSGTTSKETITTTTTTTTASSVTIENILSTKSKALSLATSSVQASLASSTRSFFNSQINTPNISVFGGMPSSTPSTSTFAVATTLPGIQITTTSSIPIFGGFTTASSITSTATAVVTTSNTVSSPFQSSLTKPTFGETATNLSTVSAPATTITTTTTTTATSVTTATTATTTATTTSTLNFGSITTASVASVFGKPASTMNTQFSTTSVVSSTASTFGKSIISPTSMPFGSSTNASIFGQIPTTSTNASVFSGTGATSIFGGNTQASPSASIFGGDSSSVNTFGTSQKSIFDNNAQNSIFGSASNSGSTSFFGGTMNNTTPGPSSPGSPSVFGGGTANNASQMGLEQPAFGQAPAFGAKPVFGSPPTFGASKLAGFSSGFGATAFGASASPPAFGSLPAMGGTTTTTTTTPAPVDSSTMPKVFGNVDGSNTFESLASQSGGLSFSSLAQKNVEAPKSPVFTSGSSFSTWR
ncbi:nuclear pore complex protein Nup214 isoform X1 [Osmia bicornis bicornis]|uniref:nuclear pore complex protein Nup214 isoform X1 n=1 Tax=Osmia bicornis bicornis TaxID=1437191 RepID=UPI001EAEE83F|nr:nuclear pore complex protein Nup214 isoform X1 [Osmia bicornis bicornis]